MVAVAFNIYHLGFSFRGHYTSPGKIRQPFVCLIIRGPLLHFIAGVPGTGLSKCVEPDPIDVGAQRHCPYNSPFL